MKKIIQYLCCLLALAPLNLLAQSTPSDYDTFASYFPDMVLGKNQAENRVLLPNTDFIRQFFTENYPPEELAAGSAEELYAVGKIIDYKGLDLFVIDHIHTRAYEDSYDNHVEMVRYVLFFQNKQLMPDLSTDKYYLGFTLNRSYYGEGGTDVFYSYFDTDTTIVSHHFTSEIESATGYDTPLELVKEFHWQFSHTGMPQLLEVTRVEFSSPFYDKAYLQENNARWEKYSHRRYPTKDDKWELDINNFHHVVLAPSNKEVRLYTYNEMVDGELTAIFETQNVDGWLLDTYTLGKPHRAAVKTADSKKNKYIKCPIIIKTSDGDVEVLPDGRFTLR